MIVKTYRLRCDRCGDASRELTSADAGSSSSAARDARAAAREIGWRRSSDSNGLFDECPRCQREFPGEPR